MPLDPAKIQTELDHRKWTKTRLATEAKMPPPRISEVFAGKSVMLETAERIADALNCPLAKLLK